MITVEQAQEHLFNLIQRLPVEHIPLINAAGRVLAQDVAANRDQPPFAASSMDGYALKSSEVERHAMFKVIGESAAGHGFDGTVGPGQTVRIFTGAPVPLGTDFVVIQEDTSRTGDLMTIAQDPGIKDNIRPLGGDFRVGTTLTAPQILTPQDIALLASMNIATVPVTRKPVIALISTGDELVLPGEKPGPHQIIASNTFGLKAMLDGAGATANLLPIARDTEQSLRTAFARAAGSDLVITIGGASVGDHDLVGKVAADLGMERSFYKVAMRPGKPLMAGRMGQMAMVGLPGNPVSAMICGYLFILPMIQKMMGLGTGRRPLEQAKLATGLDRNGPRQHYMRAIVESGQISVFDSQDSSLLTVLSQANALVVRHANDPARAAGDVVDYIAI